MEIPTANIGAASSMRRPSRIAFGSCNNQDQVNRLWPLIEERQPEAFIWGGDAVYGDYKVPTDWSTFPPTGSYLQCATPRRLRELYRRQLRVPGYRSLLEQNVTVFGTIDDHDYGCNNADKTYEFKYESAQAFVDFLGEPFESAFARRARQGEGVYGVKLFDFSRPQGQTEVDEREAAIDPDAESSGIPKSYQYSNRTVAVFVLDVRSNKTPWKQGAAAYIPDLDGDFLGERQWQWFETAIRNSKASVNIVVNGLQVHSTLFPDANIAEAWGKFPRSQKRLFDAMLQEGVESPVLISGDVHMTQLMRKDCVRQGKMGGPSRPLLELTTSGMTHSWGTLDNPPLFSPLEKPSPEARIQSLGSQALMHLLHYFSPWKALVKGKTLEPASSSMSLQYSLKKNFGEVEFDWDSRQLTIKSMGEDSMRAPLVEFSVSFDELSGRSAELERHLTRRDFALEATSSVSSEWVCVNYRGRGTVISQIGGHVATVFGLVAMVALPLFISIALVLKSVSSRRRRHWSMPEYLIPTQQT